MADKKISALTGATTPLAGTEVLPIVQSGATVKVEVSNLTAGRAISATQITLSAGNVIVANGYGVDFSATPGTGTSELFADYEEGTWTPAAGANLAIVGTPTYTGQYTKIGNTVTAWGSIAATTSVSYTAGGQIFSGLPFASQGIIAVGTVINNAFTFSSCIATLPTTTFCYGAQAMVATTAIYFQVTYHV